MGTQAVSMTALVWLPGNLPTHWGSRSSRHSMVSCQASSPPANKVTGLALLWLPGDNHAGCARSRQQRAISMLAE